MQESTDTYSPDDPERGANVADRELNELLREADRRRARTDCVFFIRQYIMTYDPRPEAYPHIIDFDPYAFQEDLVQGIISDIRNGTDEFIEKSRDMGVSWIILAVILWFWLGDPGFQALLGSRKEEYVDKRGDMKALFPKLEFMLRNIKDKRLLPRGFNIDNDRNFMRLVNPENGNAIIGESSNPNFSRGGRFTVVLFDEIGFWPDAASAWGAAGDATRCRIAVTTPPNVPSYAKTMRFSGNTHVTTIHWSLHPDKDEEWYEGEQSRRTEDEMLHEIDISWEYSTGARPYPEADALPFGKFDYNPKMPIYLSIDLGLDAVAVNWWQPMPNSHYWILLDSYEKSDKIIDWFYPFFGQPIDSSSNHIYDDKDMEMIELVRFWKRGIFFGDPSGEQRHIESKVSAYAKMRKKGINVQSNTADNTFLARREATKILLGKLYVNDTPRTRWWHECMKLAHYPKRPEESNSTSPVVKPVHDWTSHHRTSTEFFAVNYESFPMSIGSDPSNERARKPIYDSSGRLLN